MSKALVISKSQIINSNCYLEVQDGCFTIDIEKSVEKCFVKKVGNSDLIINVEGETNIIFLHNKGNSNCNITINLTSFNARATVREVVFVNETNKYKKILTINHQTKNTFSDYKFFGFALGKSELKISAKSKIGKNMGGSEAHQILRILTEGEAKAEGQPGLFIDDFDVKASHGNSIGQIDQRILYYLKSRGIDSKAARWTIIRGQMREALGSLREEDKNKIIEDIKASIL